MNLTEIRAVVRRDLHDEDSSNYRWTDNELDRHIVHAVTDFSESVPHEQKATRATSDGSRDIDISDIAGLVMVEAVEYPVDKFPRRYQRFAVWTNTITLHSESVPDGANAYIYYGKLHTLDAQGSTIPSKHEDLVVTGACGYAAMEWAVYAVNRVNAGGNQAAGELLNWSKERLQYFRNELRRLGRRNRVRIRSLYRPYFPVVNQSTDYGP